MTNDGEWAVFGGLKRKFLEHAGRQAIHARKREPLFAEIFYGWTDMIEFFAIDEQKAIMNLLDAMHRNMRVLLVVLFQIELQEGRDTLTENGSAMFSGCRKFCDNHSIIKFLLSKNLVDVFANRFHISIEKDRNLMPVEPD